MNALKYIATGLAGSTALTGVHQALKDKKDTPRVDLLGEQVVMKVLGDKKSDYNSNKLYYGTMAGDIVSNSIYYGIIAKSKNPVRTGAILGAAAGIMTVLSPKLFGLNKYYVSSSTPKKLLTVGYYLFGGLTAGLAAKKLKQ